VLISVLLYLNFENFTEFVMGKGGGAEIAYGPEILGLEMSQCINHFALVNLYYKICRIALIKKL